MIKRPFRFAITGRGSTGPEFLDFARRAEDLGFDTLAFPDHLPPPNVQLSPLLSIAAAAQVTKKIRFTTTTLFNDFRHPAILAKEVAALDMLTEGRYELGIGTGSSPADNHMSGIPIDPPGVKIERLKETLDIVRAYFSQETVNYTGKHYTITDLPGYPKPVAPLKVLIGASGPRMLRLAGREADIVSVLGAADEGGEGTPISREDRHRAQGRGRAGGRDRVQPLLQPRAGRRRPGRDDGAARQQQLAGARRQPGGGVRTPRARAGALRHVLHLRCRCGLYRCVGAGGGEAGGEVASAVDPRLRSRAQRGSMQTGRTARSESVVSADKAEDQHDSRRDTGLAQRASGSILEVRAILAATNSETGAH